MNHASIPFHYVHLNTKQRTRQTGKRSKRPKLTGRKEEWISKLAKGNMLQGIGGKDRALGCYTHGLFNI